MNKIAYTILILLFTLPLIQASSVEYQVIENKALVTINNYFSKNSSLLIPQDASAIESTLNFIIEIEGRNKRITFSEQGSGTFQYITSSIIEKAGNKYLLVLENPINGIEQTIATFPEGAILKEDGAVPKPQSITTDGRTITLKWLKTDQAIAIYGFNENQNETIIVAIIIIALVLIISFFLTKKRKEKPRKRKKQNNSEKQLTQNLLGEEKQIVLFLAKKRGRECWTKEIVKELNIPKVRLSRKLRSLEAKELIQRTPYGNENRIKLLKK